MVLKPHYLKTFSRDIIELLLFTELGLAVFGAKVFFRAMLETFRVSSPRSKTESQVAKLANVAHN